MTVFDNSRQEDIFRDYRNRIFDYLQSFLDSRAEELAGVGSWGRDVPERLCRFSCRGKALRGSLVCLAYSGFKARLTPDVTAVAAAMELLQSALLIHDDIMDQDGLRRGEPSIHAQYTQLARSKGISNPGRFGDALGLCGGDISFFLAFEILSSLPETAPSTRSALIRAFCSELTLVGLAEMDDISFAGWEREPSWEEIENQYRYKTARYSFALPLLAGGIMAAAPESELEQFTGVGEKMGLLFQIVDDELDLMRPSETIGKPSGSDVVKNKKTLHRLALFEACNPAEKTALRSIYGRKDIAPEKLAAVRDMLGKKGVLAQMTNRKKELAAEARAGIIELSLREREKTRLLKLLEYVETRSR